MQKDKPSEMQILLVVIMKRYIVLVVFSTNTITKYVLVTFHQTHQIW